MKVYLGADAQGFSLKNKIKEYLKEQPYEVIDLSEEAAKDFVDSTVDVVTAVLKDEDARGILFDETGAGSFIAGTKIKGAIVAEVSDERSAYMTREHNNTKVITLGAGILGETMAKNIVKEFLASDYTGGRHQVRVDMLNAMA